VAVRQVSREGIEVFQFHPVVVVLVPLIALYLQNTLPVRFPRFALFDLPLLVTVFFAVARRNQISGTVTGCLIGLVQDSFTHQPLGLFGIAKSVVGFAASSIGAKVDVENPGSRLILMFCFALLHNAVYMWVARGLAQLPLPWNWGERLGSALLNALVSIVLFHYLDKLKRRR